MAEKRRGLGRGISALIPQSTAPAPELDKDTPAAPVSPPTPAPDAPSDTAPEAAETAAETATGATGALPTGDATGSPRSATRPTAESRSARRRPTPPSMPTPAAANGEPRPVDVFFPDQNGNASSHDRKAATDPPGTGNTGGTEETAGGEPAGRGTPSTAAPVTDGDLLPVPGATFAEIPVTAVVPNARQPRQVFDEDDLDELTASIREVGLLQPIVVRPRPEADDGGGESTYELVMGERRWRATQQAGLETIPAIVRTTEDDDLLRDALLENLHRAQLNPLEEASAYEQLLADFHCTHEELARRIARSRPQISNTLRLLKLPPLVQRRVASGVLSAGHARALLGLPDAAAMERLAQRIVAEGLSVRSTEEIVALGDEPAAPEMRRRPRASQHSEGLERLASRLADRFDTRVKVTMGQRKGRISIEFAGTEDLERILDTLAPGDRGLAEPSLD